MNLNVKTFGLTCELVWGFGVFALTWWVIFFDGASYAPTFLGQIYRGYPRRQPDRFGLGTCRWICRGDNLRMVIQ